jgi:IS5 family transposase
MLITVNQQISFADYLIPEELTVLDDELAIIDEYLNDEKIVQPFIEHFHKKHGRPSTPLQVYIRMMYIKHMYSLSYEELHRRVSDSIKWIRFSTYPWMPKSKKHIFIKVALLLPCFSTITRSIHMASVELKGILRIREILRDKLKIIEEGGISDEEEILCYWSQGSLCLCTGKYHAFL